MSDTLGEVRSYADLHVLVRQRVADLNVSYATVDHTAGLHDGYFGKIMAKMKHLGPQTMPLVLSALGIKLIAVIDVEAEAIYTKRMPQRETAGNGMRAVESRKNKRRYANRDSRWGQRLRALQLLQMSPPQRQRSARHAAKMRWRAK
jgi:hypothetical protein